MRRRKKEGASNVIFERRFRSFFGTSPHVCVQLWDLLNPFEEMAPDNPGLQVEHLLWALLFLKLYAEESVHCGLVGGVDKKTFRKWSWLFIEYISFLETDLVSFCYSFKSFDHEILNNIIFLTSL